MHDFNSAVNHGGHAYIRSNFFILNITDLIALSSLINKYAPDRPDGGKMKIATHADQGEASDFSKSFLVQLFFFSLC